MESSIKFDGVSKFYGEREVLSNVSFEVMPGQVHGFLGPNGAGKSTTIKALSQLIEVDSGDIFLMGMPAKEFFQKNSEKLGLLSEQPPLYEGLIVRDYLNFVYSIKTNCRNGEKKIQEISEEFQLGDVSNRFIGQLSRGNKQKVAIAQAFLSNPSLVILDEPAQGLDPENIVLLRNLLRKYSEKSTIFLSSHLLHEVDQLCQSITIIDEGRIVVSGSKEKVLKPLKGHQEIVIKAEESLDPKKLREFEEKFKLSLKEKNESEYIFSGTVAEGARTQILGHLSQVHGIYDIHWKTPKLEESYLSLKREFSL